jgi:gamma-glutamylcyclotransferase (GGCT)/AIG2-like uncharacterized protein YtfP
MVCVKRRKIYCSNLHTPSVAIVLKYLATEGLRSGKNKLEQNDIMNEHYPFFVYGTLRTGEYNWEIYFKGQTEREIPATLPGHRLFFKHYPYIVETGDPQDIVLGNLVYLPSEILPDVLPLVDQLEEYDPETDSGLYLRVVRTVEYTDANAQPQKVAAWVYHASQILEYPGDPAIAITDGDWINFWRNYNQRK